MQKVQMLELLLGLSKINDNEFVMKMLVRCKFEMEQGRSFVKLNLTRHGSYEEIAGSSSAK